MLKQAVLLAGGRGTRLGELTKETPKPLLSLAGRPFLDHVVWNLKRFGIDRILFSVGYRAEQFQAHYGDGHDHGVTAEYLVEAEPLGTGGALLQALPRLEPWSLVLNADTMFDFNYLDLYRRCEDAGAAAGLALRRVPDSSRYGSVCWSADGRVTGFREKGQAGAGLVSGGVYVLQRRALEGFAGPCGSLERDLFPALAGRGELVGQPYPGFFLDVGLPESYAAALHAVPAWRRRPAAILDRDGVLNLDRAYVHRPEEFAWTEGAPEAVKWLNDNGYLVFVVTNQAGIARGYYSEEAFQRFSAWIQDELRRRGAHVDATYYCPHHPTEGQGPYRRECECRKPRPGLFRRLLEEWDLSPEETFAVGDKESDLEAARAAGVRAVRFAGGSLLTCVQEYASAK
jgi:D,D-heptose 1,7-bisphosphate phosphatase